MELHLWIHIKRAQFHEKDFMPLFTTMDSDPTSSTYSSENEAGPSSKRKRQTQQQSSSSKKPRYHEKATAAGVDLDMVRSHPKVAFLRKCINTINGATSGKKLACQGKKEALVNRIFDHFEVPEDERGPASIQYNDGDVVQHNVRKQAEKWFDAHNDASSDKSFDDCICPKCITKPQKQRNRIIPPNIPPVGCIEEAIQQVEDGTLKEIARLYRKTEHWPKLRSTYSKRQKLYAEYQRHDCDLNAMLTFHFEGEVDGISYKTLMQKIQSWNKLNL